MASAEMLVLVLVSHIAPVSAFLKGAGFPLFADIPVLTGIPLSALPAFAYVCVCVTGIGYAGYFLSIEKTSAATAAIVFYIKPALAPILALLILRESIAPTTVVGVFLIAAGSAVTLAGAARKKAA
jgi:drug/metabolite transporter (DMT)-like permease